MEKNRGGCLPGTWTYIDNTIIRFLPGLIQILYLVSLHFAICIGCMPSYFICPRRGIWSLHRVPGFPRYRISGNFRGVLNFVIFGVQFQSWNWKLQPHVPHLNARYLDHEIKNFGTLSRISRKIHPPKISGYIRYGHNLSLRVML